VSDPAPANTGVTIVHKMVDRHLVDQLIHASDGLQIYLVAVFASISAAVGCGVVLAAGVNHPQPVYGLMAILVAVSTVLALVVAKERKGVDEVRSNLDAATYELPVSLQFTTLAPGATATPTMTLGLLPPETTLDPPP
jgi:hypothetical protein